MSRNTRPISADLSLSWAGLIKYHLLVAKIPLCLLVAFSAFFGYALSAHRLGLAAWIVFISVFLLACGAASLNSYQEHRWDRLMQRTRRRPVAMGVVAPEQARRQGQILAGLGLFLLYLGTSNPAPVFAGVSRRRWWPREPEGKVFPNRCCRFDSSGEGAPFHRSFQCPPAW